MAEFGKYLKKNFAELRPYVMGEDMTKIMVSIEDANTGSPKEGDMVARNPKNHEDQWLVSAEYFNENFLAFV